MDYNFVLFRKENYLLVRYELVKKICILQVFFLILLIIYHEDINLNYYVD